MYGPNFQPFESVKALVYLPRPRSEYVNRPRKKRARRRPQVGSRSTAGGGDVSSAHDFYRLFAQVSQGSCPSGLPLPGKLTSASRAAVCNFERSVWMVFQTISKSTLK